MVEGSRGLHAEELRGIVDTEINFDGIGVVIGPRLRIHPVARRRLLEMRASGELRSDPPKQKV